MSAAPINSGITFATATGLTLPTFDVNRAKTLLDQVGWKDEGGGARTAQGVPNVPDGTKFEIDWHGFVGDQTTYGEQIRSQLNAVGITLQVKTEDNATFSRNVFAQREFDTGVASYCNGDDPEIGFRRQVDCRKISTTAFSNGAGYSNPDVDRLLDQAAREPDPAKRTPIYRSAAGAAGQGPAVRLADRERRPAGVQRQLHRVQPREHRALRRGCQL